MTKIAIVQTGGKQYVVGKDTLLTIETVKGAKDGKLTFDKVLFTDDGKEMKVGTPYLAGAKVSAEIIEEGRAPKVVVLRYRQKSRYKKAKGHRQPFAKVKITSI